jgi:hypothetical protein
MKKLLLCLLYCASTQTMELPRLASILATRLGRPIPIVHVSFQFFSPEDKDALLRLWRERLAAKILADLMPKKRDKSSSRSSESK